MSCHSEFIEKLGIQEDSQVAHLLWQKVCNPIQSRSIVMCYEFQDQENLFWLDLISTYYAISSSQPLSSSPPSLWQRSSSSSLNIFHKRKYSEHVLSILCLDCTRGKCLIFPYIPGGVCKSLLDSGFSIFLNRCRFSRYQQLRVSFWWVSPLPA